MGSVRLDEKIVELLDANEQTLPETEFRAELMATLRECYQPGESVVTAFSANILKNLRRSRFGNYLFHRSRVPGVSITDIQQKEVQLREKAAKLVEERNSRLEQQGYHCR